jgi:hypothetical protein
VAVTGEEAEAAAKLADELHQRVEAAKKLAVSEMQAEVNALKVVRGWGIPCRLGCFGGFSSKLGKGCEAVSEMQAEVNALKVVRDCEGAWGFPALLGLTLGGGLWALGEVRGRALRHQRCRLTD